MTAKTSQSAERFQAYGTVLLLDPSLTCVGASSQSADLIGQSSDALVGTRITTLFSERDAATLEAQLADGHGGFGWRRVALADGTRVKVRAFEPAPSLIGLDIVPLAAGAQTTGSQAVESVELWSEQILSTTDVSQLLQLAAETVVMLSGFQGAWVLGLEPEGHAVVLAAHAPDVGDTVGQLVVAGDFAPDQPTVGGRPIPFFVADLVAPPAELLPVPGPELGLDFSGSALLRPYDDYLQRLVDIGVQATLSIPVIVDGHQYARIIAHHPSPLQVRPAVQSELRLLGAATSTHLSELLNLQSTRERLDRATWSSRIIRGIADTGDLFQGLLADPDALLGLCSADSVLISIDGQEAFLGEPIDGAVREEILRTGRDELDRQSPMSLVASATMSALESDTPTAFAGGLLAVRLSGDSGNVIVWVRPEARRAVQWVDHRPVEGTGGALFGAMSARVEEQRGSSDRWSPAQVQAVTDFHAALATLVMARYQQVAKLNAQLARSNEEFDAFSHAAAHDLKQPIRGIRQYTEFFLEDTADKLTQDEVEQLQTVLRLTERMGAQLTDLMRYAELGETGWQRQAVDLRSAVAQALELLPPDAIADATVEILDAEVVDDPASLQQLLLNLIGNAFKYSDGDPHVTVGMTTFAQASLAAVPPETLTDLAPHTPVLFVADRGIGIDHRHRHLIFELFRKVQPRSPGSGAGLAICRRIARRHGGDIWVSSEPGRGSTFYIVTAV